MKLWFLIILAPIAYIIVDRTVRHKTTTPVWLCWLVIMLPSFIWTAWTYAFGEDQPLPVPVFLFPLIVCPLLYGWLVQRGRTDKAAKLPATEEKDLKTMIAEAQLKATPPRPINSQEETTLRN